VEHIKRSRAVALIILSLLVSLVPVGVQAQETAPTFVIDGSGWGHGVGMSQYGARALAESGQTVEQVINQYYQGVSLQQVSDVLGASHWMNADPDPLWVGLAQNQSSLRFSVSGGVAELCKANDGEGECPTQFASPGEQWEFRALGGGQCQFFQNALPVGNPGTCRGSIEWHQPGTVIKVESLGNREYARGRLRMRPIGSDFHVTLEVGVEQYVRGIAEIPPNWHPVALQAQAIAARTYGIRQALRWGDAGENGDSLSIDRKIACWCQLYSTVVDQNYVGYWAEDGPGDVPWVQAIEATAGRIITHPEAPQQTVIIAYYSSSHGGHSDTNVAGLGASPPAAPYLPSRPDPYSIAPAANNPHAKWQVTFTAAEIAAKYSLDTVTDVKITAQHDPSGSVAQVSITGTLGGTETTLVRTGRSFRSTMGMRSIFFTINGKGAIAGSCRGSVPPAGFTDVSSSSIHAVDIDCVAHEGVTKGIADGLYDPKGTVTRWQMALFLTRTAPRLGVSVPAAAPPFTDLGGLSPEAVAAIGSLAAMGVTSGTSATEFSPANPVTRWQMALFLTRLHALTGFEIPSGTSQGFTDIDAFPAGTVTAINQLAQLGITTGTTATTYSPNNSVTREQMASFLARLIRLDGVSD
jgi:SpoIID/LytB domain protein